MVTKQRWPMRDTIANKLTRDHGLIPALTANDLRSTSHDCPGTCSFPHLTGNTPNATSRSSFHCENAQYTSSNDTTNTEDHWQTATVSVSEITDRQRELSYRADCTEHYSRTDSQAGWQYGLPLRARPWFSERSKKGGT